MILSDEHQKTGKLVLEFFVLHEWDGVGNDLLSYRIADMMWGPYS